MQSHAITVHIHPINLLSMSREHLHTRMGGAGHGNNACFSSDVRNDTPLSTCTFSHDHPFEHVTTRKSGLDQ
jgi:hypothetical protein